MYQLYARTDNNQSENQSATWRTRARGSLHSSSLGVPHAARHPQLSEQHTRTYAHRHVPVDQRGRPRWPTVGACRGRRQQQVPPKLGSHDNHVGNVGLRHGQREVSETVRANLRERVERAAFLQITTHKKSASQPPNVEQKNHCRTHNQRSRTGRATATVLSHNDSQTVQQCGWF